METFKAWINAARLRTLPLSISGILVGSALANFNGYSSVAILILALCTTIGFQITSNFANDYGDGVKGTDNEDRIGPKRAYQSGLLSGKALKKGIYISIGITMLLVIVLVYIAFGVENFWYVLIFLALGLLSIWAAIRYTVGSSAYGYRGYGDIFVFAFFGILAVLGTQFLYMKTLMPISILPAIAIGALSTGVLNLNNLRDWQSDTKSNKNTLIVKMGFRKGKQYHYLLLITAFVCTLTFMVYTFTDWIHFIGLLAFVPIFVHFLRVFRVDSPSLLDPELKKLALSTFLLAILFYFSYNNFL
ncbi:1,4-dihydroxy-2-naphthoate octaprenyltransferase [Spongiimicrobium salis]|uniref:1,4-dihydroxy-2-naphthoate octaprenyltransferase n=1 Tax=Spongiimicrobium salis TaxID=1667022 RepID=UPI00374D5043